LQEAKKFAIEIRDKLIISQRKRRILKLRKLSNSSEVKKAHRFI